MLLALRRRIADGLLAGVDVIGVALSGSGAAVVAFFGKFMLAVVLGAVAVGFFLRLVGRGQKQVAVPPPVSRGSRVVAALLAAVEVAVLVEATNLPVRYGQPGFETWHWVLVLLALAVAYPLNVRMVRSLAGRRQATSKP